MARRARLQLAWTKGILDPGLSERIDLVHYYQSVRTGRNVEFLAQGGFTRRAGTTLAYPSRLRRRIEPIPINPVLITAHNGGTSANLVDQDGTSLFTTSNAPGTEDFIVCEVDIGQTINLAFVDVEGFSAADARADDALGVEWWDGTAWQPVRGPEVLTLSARASIRTTARTRRFGEAPGSTVSTRYVRVVVYGGDGIGVVSVAGLRIWAEQAAIGSAPRAIPFAKSASEVYQLVMGDFNIDVFDDGAYLASIPLPAIPHELVDEINVEQSQDTLLLFHEDVETPRITRQGAGDEWNVDVVPYADVPDLSASTAFSGASDETQQIAFAGLAAGQTIAVMLGGKLGPVFAATVAADLPGQMVTALAGIPGVDAGGLTATLTSVSPPTVEIRFHTDNGERAWPRIAVRSIGGATDVSAVSTVLRRGLPASGALIAAETGWPRAGAVYQARLIVAGMRAAPQTLLFSRSGSLYNFLIEADPMTSDLAILHTLDTDAVETIQDVFVGRHLQIFTESGEWWSDNRAFDATQPVNFILASRYGVERAVPLAFAESATLFLEKGGRTLRDFLYSDTTQSYEAEALSLLAPHLITQARSIAYRRAETTAECNQLAVVNETGTIGLLCLLRRQEVIAWADWQTIHGAVREVMTDILDRVWYIVERAGDLWLEKRDVTALTDATVETQSIGLGSVTGLPAYMEGRQVWAEAEGNVLGPFTVTGGGCNMGIASETVRIGFDFGLELESQDAREQLQNAQPFRPPGRIYEAEISLSCTGFLEFGANGGEPEEVALRHMDGAVSDAVATGDEPDNDLLDVPMLQRLFTGRALIEGLEGWTETMRWRISQSRPAPLTVRAVRLEVAMRG